MKTKERISLFLCILIIMFPIAIAQELTIIQWSGTDEVDGFIKGKDTLTIKAEAMIPWEEVISKDQLKICPYTPGTPRKCLDRDDWSNFDSCTKKTGNYYECVYSKDFNYFNPEINFQVDLYDDDNRLAKYSQKNLIVDEYAPKIIEFKISPKATLGPVNLAYVVEDYGVNPNTADKCSGIYEVEFSIDGEPILTDRENVKGVCKKTKGINYVYKGDKLEVTICAVAVDYLGRKSSPVCDNFVVDEGKPEIKEIAIVNDEDVKITHVKTGRTITASVRAEIIDESEIDDSTVEAKIPLKKTGGSSSTAFQKFSRKQGDYYYWDGFVLEEKDTGKITVKAKDVVRNEETKEFSYEIKADDKGPEVIEFFSALKDDEERPMLNYNSYLAVLFSEKDNENKEGIGMSLANAYLDLSKLGMDANKKADSCVKKNADVWECKWRILPSNFGLNIQSGVKLLTIKAGTQDDLGNSLGTNEAFEIFYQDKGPIEPKIIDFIIIPGPEGVGGEAVRGDTVKFKVASKNFEKATANFSSIGGSEEKLPIICEIDDINLIDICSFEEVVAISGPAEAQITFTFTDLFQEKSSLNYTLDIYEIQGETIPNYWRNTVTCSPNPIDRKTTSQIPQTVVCNVQLSTSSRKEVATIIGPSSIHDCIGNVTGFIDDIRTINTVSGSKNPYFMIKLPARDYYLDKLSFSCPLTIYSKDSVQKVIHKKPEIELVEMKFSFYDLPLGEFYERTEKKIKNAIDSAEDLLEVTEGFQDIMRVAEDICQWKNVITSAISTVTAVVVLLGGMQDTFRSTIPPVADAIKIVRAPICEGRETLSHSFETDFFTILDEACSIVNCQASGGKESWNIGRWVGGAAPWCMDLEKWIGESGDLAAGMKLMQDFSVDSGESQSTTRYWATNMKDNLYQSIACLCIPGIIRNIDKMAQIQCQYATCLEKDVKEHGIPLSYCEDTKHYLNCAFVWGGPLFDLLPFSSFIDSIGQMLAEMIANPVTILTTVLGAACDLYCKTEPAAIHTVCAVARITSQIGESIASIKAMTDRKSEMGMTSGAWCEEMRKWSKDFETTDDGEVLPFE
jgi:hypothetical protein